MNNEIKGRFRYNGADLAFMKKISMTDNPQVAVEMFIEKSLYLGRDPNELLEELQKESSNG